MTPARRTTYAITSSCKCESEGLGALGSARSRDDGLEMDEDAYAVLAASQRNRTVLRYSRKTGSQVRVRACRAPFLPSSVRAFYLVPILGGRQVGKQHPGVHKPPGT